MPIQTLRRITRYDQIKTLYERYERVLLPVTLVFGVMVDSFTFTNIDVRIAFSLLAAYALLAGAILLFLNAYDAGRLPGRRLWSYLRLAAPLGIQFTFGALLSGIFIFYLFSGSLFVSWPLLGLLVVLMISNDVMRKYYLRPHVQIAVYYFILFAFISIVLPFALQRIDPAVFILSGTLSLFLAAIFLFLLFMFVPDKKREWKHFLMIIGGIFLTLNILYAFNRIPPIPLAIRDAAVAQELTREGDIYVLEEERRSWQDRLLPGQTIHFSEDRQIFVYTAIFAPKGLDTRIVHHWKFFDTQTGKWFTHAKPSFSLRGGRAGGFRGYSLTNQLRPGTWRVDVETERGQVLGRLSFKAKYVDEIPKLERTEKR